MQDRWSCTLAERMLVFGRRKLLWGPSSVALGSIAVVEASAWTVGSCRLGSKLPRRVLALVAYGNSIFSGPVPARASLVQRLWPCLGPCAEQS